MDGGANCGGFGEDDCVILECVENAHVGITGVADMEIAGLRIAQGASVVDTVHDGPVIAIMSQQDHSFKRTVGAFWCDHRR